MKYRYIGNGDFIAGIPARDLAEEEARRLGERRIRASGLYQEIKIKKEVIKQEVEQWQTE